jgi:alcohol dehydrogenase class IV
MIEPFTFRVGTEVSFGRGASRRLPEILERHGWKRVGLVVDHGLRGAKSIGQLIESLQASGRLALAWCDVSEPTYDALEAMRPQFAGQDLEAMIGIGGGSALDMAKAMAVLVHNREPAIAYRGFDRMTEPVLPVVAVPTTAGTGSEVTPNASFVDAREKRKMGINGEAVRPRIALLDPELTLTCPARATVSAGVDSLVHATEAYVAKKTNAMARLLALQGFARVFNTLPLVVATPDDLTLRSDVMFGAFLAGLALMHSGTGPAAAMSYPLGVHHGIPHGLGGAAFLPHVARYNVAHGVHDYADLYLTMADAEPNLPRARQADEFVIRVLATWSQLGVPQTLGKLGVAPMDVDRVVRETLVLEGALGQNPVPFAEDQIRGTMADLAAGVA